MAKVTFILKDGSEEVLDIEEGYSLMELAKLNDIEGIEAICGGACSCATCHVHVDEKWQAQLPKIDALEDAMLDTNSSRDKNSRLSCQIRLSKELDGLTVEVGEAY